MKPEGTEQAGRTPERIAVEIAVRLVLLGMFAWVALMLLKPFLPIVLWSAVLTVAFYPIFEWLRDHLGGRSWLAAFGVTAAAVAVTAGPTTVLLASLVHSLEELGRHLGTPPIKLPPLPPEFVGLPVVGPQLAAVWNSRSSNLEEFLGRYGHLLVGPGEWALGMATGLAGSLVVIFAALIVSGCPLCPGAAADRRHPRARAALIGERGDAFIELAETTVRAVARGMVGVAVVQALLIGLGLIVMQVPAAGALTVAAFFLCTVRSGAPDRRPDPDLGMGGALDRRRADPDRLAGARGVERQRAEAALPRQGAGDADGGDPDRRLRRHDRLRAEPALPRPGGAGGVLRPGALLAGARRRPAGADRSVGRQPRAMRSRAG